MKNLNGFYLIYKKSFWKNLKKMKQVSILKKYLKIFIIYKDKIEIIIHENFTGYLKANNENQNNFHHEDYDLLLFDVHI